MVHNGRIARAVNSNIEICSYCKFIVTLWSLISKSMILSVMNIYGFISRCTIHYSVHIFSLRVLGLIGVQDRWFFLLGPFREAKAISYLSPDILASIQTQGARCKWSLRSSKYHRVILIRGDNQEGWMKLLGSVEPFVDEAPLTIVGRFIVSTRPDLSVLRRNVENRSLLQSPLN